MASLRGSAKWGLFFSSYIPLYLILILKHRNITVTLPRIDHAFLSIFSQMEIPVISMGWLLLTVGSAFVLYNVISLRQSRGGTDIKTVESSRSRDDLITNYILVYVFPFVVLNYSNLVNWLAFIIFFAVIAIIQVRSNHLYVNPVLAAFDYRIYEIDTGNQTLTVVTKGEIDEPVDELITVELSNNVFLTPY